MMDSCFRKELAVMKDKIRNSEDGCWQATFVCSEAGVCVRPPPLTSVAWMIFSFHERWNSKVGSQIILRRVSRALQTMQLRNF